MKKKIELAGVVALPVAWGAGILAYLPPEGPLSVVQTAVLLVSFGVMFGAEMVLAATAR